MHNAVRRPITKISTDQDRRQLDNCSSTAEFPETYLYNQDTRFEDKHDIDLIFVDEVFRRGTQKNVISLCPWRPNLLTVTYLWYVSQTSVG